MYYELGDGGEMADGGMPWKSLKSESSLLRRQLKGSWPSAQLPSMVHLSFVI